VDDLSKLALMSSLIEDYAVIGDTETVALVARTGSIDWFCVPRFDGGACFASLLGGHEHGRWLLHPSTDVERIDRRYVGDTMVLETLFHTPTGSAALIDFMPIRDEDATIVRIVEGRSGTVEFMMELIIRFDYGYVVPWVKRYDTGIAALGGCDALRLSTPATLKGRDLATFSEFIVREGERMPFVLTWFESHKPVPSSIDAFEALENTKQWWTDWASRCTYDGDHKDTVLRSLLTLKTLTYAPTGGVVAAATTSLPESLGGVRNWDYRFCWLRDATFTLAALSDAGYAEEAVAWSEWLRRAVAGSPKKMQIMYGVGGERRLQETELDWLQGYEHSAPVRIGNAASEQFQLDVYGEVMDMFLHSRHCLGHELADDVWDLARILVEHVENVWTEPDEGIWEVRGPRRHFVHSKVMAWVAVDRWVQLCEAGRPTEDLQRWRDLRDDMHRDICDRGYNASVGAFTQYYGASELDASCLMLALVGFLPPDDPRVIGTVDAIQRDLVVDGFVKRYHTSPLHHDDGHVMTVDGLPPGEGAFMLTTFWLADNLILQGRLDEARAIFDRIAGLTNDLGLLSEEYDVDRSRMVGNFPQAFSHVGLIVTAMNLRDGAYSPATHRCSPVEVRSS
jgi:GH15 family glucan-1,4-alpha-glucosidase